MMSKKSLIEPALLQQLIPQKKPFVMLSVLYEVNQEIVVTGLKIEEDNILNQKNHFSEAGLLENMAQSIALKMGYLNYLANERKVKIGFIGAIKTAQFYRMPKIGEEIYTKVSLIQEFMDIQLSKAEVLDAQENIIASAEIKTAIAPST
ncbi:hypothetical protein ACFQ3R_01630 [Mesonia ostreae]|uniref:3-hydroxymyristoyl/3-hydroxydecanoyl-(Acyl carrier protein) dehydratase n=1 Tax=Mesonia ostreae TaxID=861110 RepID=A0ABU2KI84_9FLAO|nr:hypothetical protein [Mesonia ostreae]MDT0294384.1 hypothetical protein [Mesonia ostreae]